MIRSVAVVLALAAAGPVNALSCIAPSVAQTYTFAAESPENYVIGVGSLNLIGPSNPPEGAVAQGGDINQMVGYTQPAQFDGALFTGATFDNTRVLPVTVNVTCVAAWCGAAQDVNYGMFFFRQVNGGYVLDEEACPGNVFADAHPGLLQEVIACHQGTCPGAW
ncbi:hypothetical protein [Gymnodinialimonas ulvae]|uniref:hypothetical protein n=1 Tax=Gymnodinialimonas ulvae TaxID=3126504 RepID=UPI00309FA92C